MKGAMLGILLLTARSQAQVTGDCGKIILCPQFFMPQPSTTGDKTAAIQAFADAQAADRDEKDAERLLQSRWKKIKTDLSEGLLNRLLGVNDEKVRAVALSDPQYLSLMKDYQIAQTKNYSAHNEAIIQTGIAYNLTPPISDFTGDPRAAEGNMVAKPWLPHYSRLETFNKKKGWHKRDPDELSKEMRDEGAIAAALTHADGSIGIFDIAFTSPDELAVLIFHETSHWVDIAGRSGGFNKSDPPAVSFLSEARAYANAAGLAGRLGLDATWQINRAARFTFQAEESVRKKMTPDEVLLMRGWIGKQRVGMFASAPPADDMSEADKSLLESKMAEAKDFANAERRKQLEIIHRDHDARLRNTMADMARRSCESPGSVTQAELDGLPDPYVQDDAGWTPSGLSECAVWVYMNLGRGVDAKKIQDISTPKDMTSAMPVPKGPDTINGVATTVFIEILPKVRDFSIASCRSHGQTPLTEDITRPSKNILFSPADDLEAERLSSGLEACEGRLFRRLIGVIRTGNPQNITLKWLKDRVIEYTPPAGENNGQTSVSPPFQQPPDYDPCKAHGNERCP